METAVGQAPVKKKAYHHGDLRNAIITQAVARARETGEKAIVLREIAAEIGVSATAAYRHFANRAQLVDDVAAKGYEALLEHIDLAPVTDGGAEPTGERAGLAAYLDLRNACLALLDFTVTERSWTRLMIECLGTSDGVREVAARCHTLLDARLRRGEESGVLVRDHAFAGDRVFWSGLDGLGTIIMFTLFPGASVEEILGDAAGRMLDLCSEHVLTDAGRAAVAAAGPLPARVVTDLTEWVPA